MPTGPALVGCLVHLGAGIGFDPYHPRIRRGIGLLTIQQEISAIDPLLAAHVVPDGAVIQSELAPRLPGRASFEQAILNDPVPWH